MKSTFHYKLVQFIPDPFEMSIFTFGAILSTDETVVSPNLPCRECLGDQTYELFTWQCKRLERLNGSEGLWVTSETQLRAFGTSLSLGKVVGPISVDILPVVWVRENVLTRKRH